jgi:DNA topoisomerase-3
MALLRGLGVPELTSPELTGQWEFKLKQMERGQLERDTFMQEIAAMTQDIVRKAKEHEHDTIPGDFGTLQVPCPKCGAEIKETYKKFQCIGPGCGFALWKIVAGRQFEPGEIEQLIRERRVGPLQGFRSKLGRQFNAVIRLTDELKPEFDFGQDQGGAGEDGAGGQPDFSGHEAIGQCPKCGSRIFESGTNYLCEQAAAKPRRCDFRCGRIILQQPVDRDQFTKLLTAGKTDLLTKFVSKRGRPFSAYLVLGADKAVGFEFEPRANKARGQRSDAPKEPAPRLDFSGQESLGSCPRCRGRVFESAENYVCERSQAEKRPCKFKAGKTILKQPIDREQMRTLLTTGRTSLLDQFISRRGHPFKAWLVLKDGKVAFEFPDKEE